MHHPNAFFVLFSGLDIFMLTPMAYEGFAAICHLMCSLVIIAGSCVLGHPLFHSRNLNGAEAILLYRLRNPTLFL
jgi:hypothetical protein